VGDTWLQLLPVDPTFRPDPLQRGRGLNAFRRLVPDAWEAADKDEGAVVFVDAGENFESIRCHLCTAEISVDWWKGAMDVAWGSRFEDLAVRTPCCKQPASLNDLDYTWPQGFARWYLRASSPNRTKLAPDEIAAVESALGIGVREVWTHN
jgi:hypothetical protein